MLLAGGLLSLVTLLSLTQPLPRLDQLLQDSARAALAPPPSDDIVIVAIDETSLAALGRPPWRRAVHAELVRRIAAQSPRCIGLRLELSGPDADHPGDDAVLARAMRDSGCVVLPMAVRALAPQQLQEGLPAPILAAAAAGIGHTHLAFDQDGVARSVYLHEGFAGRMVPHFALALRDAAAGHATPALPPRDASPPGPWLRRDQQAILFTRGPERFRTVSYVDVLDGRVPSDVFRDRYVLVGPTAPSLGDVHANTSPDVPGLMPGVEIFANVLQSLTEGRPVVIATPWQDLLFNVVPLIVALLGVLWLRPVAVVGLIGAMLALQLGIHLGRPAIGVLFAPAAGVTGLLLLYPLWSLMRLSATVRYLRRGSTEVLRDVGRRPPALPRLPGDFLDRQMEAARAAVDSMRDMHRFVRDGIDHLPDATMTLDTRGRVVLANAAALGYWGLGAPALVGADAHALAAGIRRSTTGAPMLPPGALGGNGLQPILGEGIDLQGRSLLLRCVPFFNADNAHAGWMMSLVDISEMRRAQGQRDEALRFISHDAREPAAAILTLLELARQRPDALSREALLANIERKARCALELADDFVSLARAEAERFRPEVLDLVALVHHAIDDAWALARQRQVRVTLAASPDEAPCIADRMLLGRALANVLGNALKFSPPGADLACSVGERDGHWLVSVRDRGPGIPVALQSKLFQPFQRLHETERPEVHGVGLGLLLVRAVMQRHGGRVEIDSAEGAGCTVTLVLPQPTAAEREALASE